MAAANIGILRTCYNELLQDNPPACILKLSRKDNQVAEKHLSQGDQFFSKGFFIDAIDKYNESLCYAHPDAENPFKRNDIYTKRAFALFRMDLPRECLESIRLAEAGYWPEHLRERLTKLTSRCEEKIKLLGDEELKNFHLKLSYPSHEKIPFMANCLELRTTEEFGRHIVTNRDLKVGDVVMIEKPFVSCLRPEENYKRCTNCMAGNKKHALIPCPICTRAMFCSDECQKEAWNDFHRFECKIAANLPEDECEQLALRTFCLGISICGGLEAFQKYLTDNQASKLNAFDLDYTETDRRLKFLVLHNNLYTKDPEVSQNTIYIALKTAAVANFLLQAKVFPKDQLDFALATIYRYMYAASQSFFGSSRPIGVGGRIRMLLHLQLAMCLVNHSCIPNVLRFQQDNKQLLMVCRPIRQGEVILNRYYKAYYDAPKAERHTFLRCYGFKCKCEACEKNYPVLQGFRYKNIPPIQGADYYERLYGRGDVAKLKFAESLAKYLQDNDHLTPCVNLYEALMAMDTTYWEILDGYLWQEQDKLRKYKEVEVDESRA